MAQREEPKQKVQDIRPAQTTSAGERLMEKIQTSPEEGAVSLEDAERITLFSIVVYALRDAVEDGGSINKVRTILREALPDSLEEAKTLSAKLTRLGQAVESLRGTMQEEMAARFRS